MKRFVGYALPILMLGTLSHAKMLECRVIIGSMENCNPYSQRFLRAKEIQYEPNRKKLIVEKTLPVPLKPRMHVISVDDLIEDYVKVEEPKRFKGTGDESYFKSLKPKTPEPQPTPSSVATTKPPTQESNVTQPPKSSEVAVTPIKPKQPAKESVAKTSETKTKTQTPVKPPVPQEGSYVVKKGDTLSKIALMYGIRTKKLMQINKIKKKDHLKIGQKIKIPMPQKKIDAIARAEYKIEEGDYLIGIAKMFGLTPKALADANNIKRSADVRIGRVLKLPLPYKLAEEKAKRKRELEKKRRNRAHYVSRFGKHRLRVTATAYTSHRGQTDKTPFLAAWNNRLRPGMKVIAVSRDLLYKYGMRNGTKVKIAGLPGYYRVRDKMNKRYKKRIDIYMGTNRRKALRWGRRSVVIYW